MARIDPDQRSGSDRTIASHSTKLRKKIADGAPAEEVRHFVYGSV